MFIQIPVGSFQPTPEGQVCYEVSLGVEDSTGLQLEHEKWKGHATFSGPAAADVTTLEMVEFAVAPGRYRVAVAASDSASGRTLNAESRIEGFVDEPLASDLVLSSRIRTATAADTLPQRGEWSLGGATLITGTTSLILAPNRARVYYLLEAYTAKADTGRMSVQIADSSGRILLRTPPAPIKVEAGGGVLRGDIDLAGLPPGQYSFAVSLGLGGRQVTRTGPLTMKGVLESPVARGGELAADTNVDDAYFSGMSADQLDAAEAPLVYIAESGELASYGGLSVPGRARFLAEFWRRRDPTPTDGNNEARTAFYRKIDEANANYRERGRGTVAGWRSDRGRIFLRYGAPDDVMHQEEAGQTPALEIWKYTRQRNRYFVFADRNRMGAFSLLLSNELKEPGLPNWQDVIGPYGVRAVMQYVTGINPSGPTNPTAGNP